MGWPGRAVPALARRALAVARWPSVCSGYGLLAARIRRQGRGGRMRNASRASHSGLPAPADLFVGRDGELATVSRMLASARARLVTLTGPPGIGKTRLAVACAAAHAERSGYAAVFVDLAPVRDPALVLAELAQAVGVEPRGGTELTEPAGCGAGQRGAARGPGQLRASAGRRPRTLARLLDRLPAAAGARDQPGTAPAVRRAGVPGAAAGHARARRRSPTSAPWRRIRRWRCCWTVPAAPARALISRRLTRRIAGQRVRPAGGPAAGD